MGNPARGPLALHQRARCAECVRCCALHVGRSSCCALCYGENECRRSWAMCSKRPHRFKSSSPHPSQRPLRQSHTRPPPSSRRLYTYSSLKRRLAGAQRLPSRTARRFASPSLACSLAEALGAVALPIARRQVVDAFALQCAFGIVGYCTSAHAAYAIKCHFRAPACALPLAHSHLHIVLRVPTQHNLRA
jgi:hypothetical protein